MTAEPYFDNILEITRDYLGPASERFVRRQIDTHLKKSPAQLDKNDLLTLAIRIRSGLLVLTQDEGIVDEAYHRITALADG